VESIMCGDLGKEERAQLQAQLRAAVRALSEHGT
jgi:hypothetical protein